MDCFVNPSTIFLNITALRYFFRLGWIYFLESFSHQRLVGATNDAATTTPPRSRKTERGHGRKRRGAKAFFSDVPRFGKSNRFDLDGSLFARPPFERQGLKESSVSSVCPRTLCRTWGSSCNHFFYITVFKLEKNHLSLGIVIVIVMRHLLTWLNLFPNPFFFCAIFQGPSLA